MNMAQAHTVTGFGAAHKGAGLGTLVATLRSAWARHRLISRTSNELRALSDRELADLGIHRSMIGQIAREAADNA